MSLPNFDTVEQVLRATRAAHDPVKTRSIPDYHEFYKLATRLVEKEYEKHGLEPTEDALISEVHKVFRKVLELDDSPDSFNYTS